MRADQSTRHEREANRKTGGHTRPGERSDGPLQLAFALGSNRLMNDSRAWSGVFFGYSSVGSSKLGCGIAGRFADGVLGNCFLAMKIFSLRNPDGADPKKMVDDPNLVCEKKTKTETQKSRAIHEPIVKPRNVSRGDHKRRRDCRSDKPHADYRADAEYGEVKRRP
jgi:hypothetical protein